VTTERHALKVRLNVETGADEGLLAGYHRSGTYDWTAFFDSPLERNINKPRLI